MVAEHAQDATIFRATGDRLTLGWERPWLRLERCRRVQEADGLGAGEIAPMDHCIIPVREGWQSGRMRRS